MEQPLNYDVLIIGSGLAGLSLALQLPPSLHTAILCKSGPADGASWVAQGGIAAVIDASDSLEQHTNDTLKAGDGLCHEESVRFTVGHGYKSIQWLLRQNVPFTKDTNEQLHLNLEGGHSRRRVAHVADKTGKAVTSKLFDCARLAPNIDLFENHTAIDLILSSQQNTNNKFCAGVYTLNTHTNAVHTFTAKTTVLATGGASKVYLYSSSSHGSTGDGIAMAWRAGCRVSNLEFNQFHPTCLYHHETKPFLISETLRGEGAVLLDLNGRSFMKQYDDRAELAPRDVVARAIDHTMKKLGHEHVYLDISHQPSDFIRTHFPSIYQHCMHHNIDITKEPIPVVPGAHYTCGGIITNHFGVTDIPQLYAVGETACTGLHGANRLASNSLLECLVYGQSAAKHITQHIKEYATGTHIPLWDSSEVSDSDDNVVISHSWNELRHFMWDYVGIVRTDKRLLKAQQRINILCQDVQEFYSHFKVSHDLIELRHLVQVAKLIIECALKRKESRGLHYTLDYPNKLQTATDTILYPEQYSHKSHSQS